MAITPEGKIKQAFVQAAKEADLTYINLINTGSKGDPDKLALPRFGPATFLEFKNGENGTLSEFQRHKIEHYRYLGYPVFVIDNIPDAVTLAKAMGSGFWADIISCSWWKASYDDFLENLKATYEPR